MKKRNIAAVLTLCASIALQTAPVFATENQEAGETVSTQETRDRFADQIAAAQSRVDAAQAKIDQGSLGFFQTLADEGDTAAAYAARIISATGTEMQDEETINLSAYTSLGAADDATGLENMKKAVDELDEVNRYRRNENTTEGTNLADLKVSHKLMAITQVQLNYSADIFSHASQFNTGENIAWGSPNPFTAWYDEEKAVFKAGEDGETGHYKNVVSRRYDTMGYAYRKSNTYRFCYGQDFSLNGTFYSQGAVTVDEYKALFNTYYDAVHQELADAESDLAYYTEARKGWNLLNTALTTALSLNEQYFGYFEWFDFLDKAWAFVDECNKTKSGKEYENDAKALNQLMLELRRTPASFRLDGLSSD